MLPRHRPRLELPGSLLRNGRQSGAYFFSIAAMHIFFISGFFAISLHMAFMDSGFFIISSHIIFVIAGSLHISAHILRIMSLSFIISLMLIFLSLPMAGDGSAANAVTLKAMKRAAVVLSSVRVVMFFLGMCFALEIPKA